MEGKEVRCKRSQSSGLAWRSLSVVSLKGSDWDTVWFAFSGLYVLLSRDGL